MNKNELDWNTVVKYSKQLLELGEKIVGIMPQKEVVKRIRNNNTFKKINETNFGLLLGQRNKNGLWKRIVSGDIPNKSDFHNEKNNNSAKDLYNYFPYILNVFEQLYEELDIKKNVKKEVVHSTVKEDWEYGMRKNIAEAKNYLIERKFLGLYQYYTHSEEKKEVFKQPLLIRSNPVDGSIEVFLGNKHCSYRYKGVVLKIEGDLLHLSLLDFHRNISELVQITVSFPNKSQPTFFRGCYIKKGSQKQPIAGRVVIVLDKPNATLKKFNKSKPDRILYSYIGHRDDPNQIIIAYLRDPFQSHLYFQGSFMDDMRETLYSEKVWLMKKTTAFENYSPLNYTYFENFGDYNELMKEFPSKVRGTWIGYYEFDREFPSVYGDPTEVVIFIIYLEQIGSNVFLTFQRFSNYQRPRKGKGKGFISDEIFSVSYISESAFETDPVDHLESILNGSMCLNRIGEQLEGSIHEIIQIPPSSEDYNHYKFPSHAKILFNKTDVFLTETIINNEFFLYPDFNQIYIYYDLRIDTIEEREVNPRDNPDWVYGGDHNEDEMW